MPPSQPCHILLQLANSGRHLLSSPSPLSKSTFSDPSLCPCFTSSFSVSLLFFFMTSVIFHFVHPPPPPLDLPGRRLDCTMEKSGSEPPPNKQSCFNVVHLLLHWLSWWSCSLLSPIGGNGAQVSQRHPLRMENWARKFQCELGDITSAAANTLQRCFFTCSRDK